VSELKAGAVPALFKFESWPDTPNDVCKYLEQHTKQLRAAGLDVRLNVQAGLRMIEITWLDGIRRQPPIAIDPKAPAILPDSESNKSKVERLAAGGIEPRGVLNSEPAPDPRGDLNADKWEQFRNVPMRFRIDEDGRRRRRMTKLALATVIVGLVFAIILWARHQWREASLHRPTVLSGSTYFTYPTERLALSKLWTKL